MGWSAWTLASSPTIRRPFALPSCRLTARLMPLSPPGSLGGKWTTKQLLEELPGKLASGSSPSSRQPFAFAGCQTPGSFGSPGNPVPPWSPSISWCNWPRPDWPVSSLHARTSPGLGGTEPPQEEPGAPGLPARHPERGPEWPRGTQHRLPGLRVFSSCPGPTAASCSNRSAARWPPVRRSPSSPLGLLL